MLFWKIQHTTSNIDKTLAKNTDSDVLRVTGKPLSVGSTVAVVVTRGNVAMLHANVDIVLCLVMLVGSDVCAIWPAKRERDISFFLVACVKKLVLLQNRPKYWAGPLM